MKGSVDRSSDDLEIHIKNEAGSYSINPVPVIQSYTNQSELGVCLGGKPSEYLVGNILRRC